MFVLACMQYPCMPETQITSVSWMICLTRSLTRAHLYTCALCVSHTGMLLFLCAQVAVIDFAVTPLGGPGAQVLCNMILEERHEEDEQRYHMVAEVGTSCNNNINQLQYNLCYR